MGWICLDDGDGVSGGGGEYDGGDGASVMLGRW